MSRCHGRTVDLPFGRAMTATTGALGRHGSGVPSGIDMQATPRKKPGAETRLYRIPGACNPQMAHRAPQAEPLTDTLLPCNVVVCEREDSAVEIAAIDSVAFMQAVGNPELAGIAGQVRDMLRQAVGEAAG